MILWQDPLILLRMRLGDVLDLLGSAHGLASMAHIAWLMQQGSGQGRPKSALVVEAFASLQQYVTVMHEAIRMTSRKTSLAAYFGT